VCFEGIKFQILTNNNHGYVNGRIEKGQPINGF
jgi:hypothetical protein